MFAILPLSAPPPRCICDITSCPAGLGWTVTLNTLDRLLIGPQLHFPSRRSTAVPADPSVLKEVMKSTSCFRRGSVVLPPFNEILMTNNRARRTFRSPDTHSHKQVLRTSRPTQHTAASTPHIVNSVFPSCSHIWKMFLSSLLNQLEWCYL